VKHKMIVYSLAFVAFILLAALLSSCAPAPSYCTASERVDVYDGIPSATNNPNVVDWLEPGQETIVTARVDGWYEITTPKLVDGYVSVSLCEAGRD